MKDLEQKIEELLARCDKLELGSELEAREWLKKALRTFALDVIAEIEGKIPKKTGIDSEMTNDEQEGWNEAVNEFRSILKSLKND